MAKTQNNFSDINTSRVLRIIWQRDGISRIEIAHELGLDKSTVTKIIYKLDELGIIVEDSEGEPGPLGGRRPIYLRLNSNFACTGGVEINPESVVSCIIDIQGNFIYKNEETLPPGTYSTDDYCSIFYRTFKKLEKEANKCKIPLVGVGLGLPALVNSDDGIIIQSVPLMMDTQFNFVKEISSKISIPVIIENDARCCCFGEQLFSSDNDFQNMLYVLTEYRSINPEPTIPKNISIGLGLVINNKIIKGSEWSAGEFRSIMWQEGQEGQVKAQKGVAETLEMKHLKPIFFELAQHIAFLVNTLNIEQVYVGGLEGQYNNALIELIKERLMHQWPYRNLPRKLSVSLASLESFAVAFGAASMILDQFFLLPSVSLDSGSERSIKTTILELI